MLTNNMLGGPLIKQV